MNNPLGSGRRQSAKLRHPPDFLIIGAARSGTSALATYLDQHPQLCFTRPKETHFFAFAHTDVRFAGPGDDFLINQCSVTQPQAFDSLAGKCKDARICGEGSVSTLYYHDVSIPNIQSYAPGAKLIALLRHPVERAFSSFQYMRSRGLEPLTDFQQALDLEDHRIGRGWHHIWHYMRMGFYYQSIKHFMESFPADQVRVYFYDDFSSDASAVARDILDYLQLDREFCPRTDLRVNRSGEVRNRLMATIIKGVLANAGLRAAFRGCIPFSVRERMRNVVLKSPAIPVEARQRLLGIYKDDIDNLRKLVGKVPESWLRP